MKPSVLLIAVAILVVSFGCRSERTRTVPDELVGVWKTSEPKYADRFLELTRTSIAFGAGEGKADVRPVAGVEIVRQDGKILYTLSYADPEGHESTFSFYYDPARAGVSRLKNQQSFEWTKQGG